MTVDQWIELRNDEPGLYQLVGAPSTNYNLLLYGKALLARREGHTIFFIDNQNIIDLAKLKMDFQDDTSLLESFFLFSPKNLYEFVTMVDDLELQYFPTAEKPVICISGIFECLVNYPTHAKKLGLMAYILGLLRQFEIPVFVTNEMRSNIDMTLPFLAYLLPPFFTKVFIVEVQGKETNLLQYSF